MAKYGIKVETIDGKALLTCGDGQQFRAYLEAHQYEFKRIIEDAGINADAFREGVYSTLCLLKMSTTDGTGLYDFYYLAALASANKRGNEVNWPAPDAAAPNVNLGTSN